MTIDFVETEQDYGDYSNYLYTAETPVGRFTVLDRMTGFGWRGIESGYLDHQGDFYLVEGEDFRESSKTPEELALWVKENYAPVPKRK